jgi:hypothetical protein
VTTPFAPKRIDISFMRPEMILLPVDLSPGLAQNPSVQVTPEQWMIFSYVNGQTSLHNICNGLGIPAAQVCQVVGELIAEGLIQLCMPDGAPVQESIPYARDTMVPGMNNGYIAPGYASMPVPSWSPSPSTPEAAGFGNGGFETQSQWGNGGNRANFVSGQGWGTPQSSLPSQMSGPLGPRPNTYAPVGRN